MFVFTLFFGVLLYNVIGFKAMDEISGLILLVLYVIYLFTTNNKRLNAGLLITLAIFIFYFCYSVYVSINIHKAIILDFLIQIRPYLTFFIVSQISPSFSDSQKLLLKRFCVIMWLFMIAAGIYGFLNPSFFITVFEQPADYVVNIGCLSLVYLFCSNFSIRDRILFIVMFAAGLLATQTHFYSILLLTCGILLYFHRPYMSKFKLRTGIALAVVILVVVHIGRVQISEYVSSANTESQTSHFYLYKTSVDILKDYLPLGSGFASFGTYASGLYYSKMYSSYGLTSIDGLSQKDWFSVSDSYYPSLAQFGIVGIILYLFFWGVILSKALARFKEKGDTQLFVLVLIVASFVFIENMSDSFFTSNKGYYMMMFLGVLFGKKKMPNHTPDNYDNTLVSTPIEYTIENVTVNNDTRPINNKSSDVEISSENKLQVEENRLEKDRIIYQMPPIPIREEDLLEKEMQAYTSQLLEKDEAGQNYQEQEDPNEDFYEDEDDFDDDEYDDTDFEDEEDTFDSGQRLKQENIKETSTPERNSEKTPDSDQGITDGNDVNKIVSRTETASLPTTEKTEDGTSEITDMSSSQNDDNIEKTLLTGEDDNKELEELPLPVKPQKKKIVKTNGKSKQSVRKTEIIQKNIPNEDNQKTDSEIDPADIIKEKADTFTTDTPDQIIRDIVSDNNTTSTAIINHVANTDDITGNGSKETYTADSAVRQYGDIPIQPVENTTVDDNSSIPETHVDDNAMINISTNNRKEMANNNHDEILLPASETDITHMSLNSDLVKEYIDIVDEYKFPHKKSEEEVINASPVEDYTAYLKEFLLPKEQSENTSITKTTDQEEDSSDEEIDYTI